MLVEADEWLGGYPSSSAGDQSILGQLPELIYPQIPEDKCA